MDKYIKQSIEARKQAIFSAYELEEGEKKKIDALFGEIEKLGVKCEDVGEFETKFQQSPLNQKYLDLFTEIATGARPKASVGSAKVKGTGAVISSVVAEGIVGGVADRALDEVEKSVLPTRAAVNQKVADEVRKVPVLGDVIDIGQKASYVGHLAKVFGRKKKK